jgi:hypothetical protein
MRLLQISCMAVLGSIAAPREVQPDLGFRCFGITISHLTVEFFSAFLFENSTAGVLTAAARSSRIYQTSEASRK